MGSECSIQKLYVTSCCSELTCWHACMRAMLSSRDTGWIGSYNSDSYIARFWVRAVNVSNEVITSFVCVNVDLQVILSFNITTSAMCKNPAFGCCINSRANKCLWKQFWGKWLIDKINNFFPYNGYFKGEDTARKLTIATQPQFPRKIADLKQVSSFQKQFWGKFRSDSSIR
jgi:hypothetical protein